MKSAMEAKQDGTVKEAATLLNSQEYYQFGQQLVIIMTEILTNGGMLPVNTIS